MRELKSLTVRYLRELARQHLGKGHSKLKTKEELVDALKKFVPDLLKAFGRHGSGELMSSETVIGSKRSSQSVPPTVEPAKVSTTPAKIVKTEHKAATKPIEAATRETVTQQESLASKAPVVSTAKPKTVEPKVAEPLVEGFFVARVAGEQEARRHGMTEESGRQAAEFSNGLGYDELLGELPFGYDDDSAYVLPRDTGTLFVFWDFRRSTRDEAARGLVDPRAVLRVYESDYLVREIDFAFESRCFYIHGLPPGRHYRVEAHFVGRDGISRRVGRSTNVVALPNMGPSSDTSVRFLRVPWELPLSQLRARMKEGRLAIEERGVGAEYMPAPRFVLPTSASMPFGLPGPFVAPFVPGLHGWIPPASGRPY